MASAYICEECPRTLVCIVDGCPNPEQSRGWCSKHYSRWRKYGDPLALGDRETKRQSNVVAALERKEWLRLRDASFQIRQPRTCHACDRVFFRTGGNGPNSKDSGKFCSRECSFEWLSFKAGIKRPVFYTIKKQPTRRKCQCCDTLIRIEPYVKRCATCSEQAKMDAKRRNREANKLANRLSGRKAAARKARKLRQRGVAVESVNPIKVLDRDNWTCQLCGVKTPRKLRGSYADRAPEIDHILPISQGGEHSYRNVQCACRRCNIVKAGVPRGQMLLFG